MIITYKCINCEYTWKHRQGPSMGWNENGYVNQPNPPPINCSSCGWLYIVWFDYPNSLKESKTNVNKV